MSNLINDGLICAMLFVVIKMKEKNYLLLIFNHMLDNIKYINRNILIIKK